jgi:translation initiation factor IF-2
MARDNSLKSFYNFIRAKVSINKSSSKTKGVISKNNMTNNKKPIRLSKAAREFNVSIGTIVDFLNKKGHDISSNPNTKITPEMYELLLKEYSKEKTVKEEAKKHSLKYTKRKSISLDDEQKEPQDEDVADSEDAEEEEEEETVFIKNASTWTTPPESAQPEKTPSAGEEGPAAQEQPEAEEDKETPAKEEDKEKERETTPGEAAPEIQSPKVVGKIELDKAEEKKEAPAGREDDKKKSEPQKAAETGGEKPAAEQQPATEQKKEKPSEKEIPSEEKDPAAKEKAPEQPAAGKEAATPPAPDAEPVKVEGEKKKEKKAADQKKKATKKKPAAEKSAEKEQPEEQGKAPAKDTEKQPSASRDKEQPPVAEESGKQPEKKEEEADKKAEGDEKDFIKTKVERLNGPTILGTIDLPEKQKRADKKRPEKRRDKGKKVADTKGKDSTPQKKKPVASSSDESLRPKKRKRRRIATGSEQQGEKRAEAQQPQKGKPGKRPAKKQAVRKRHEPSEEEVQKQVKETLARLSGGGKSKSSKHRRNKRDTAKVQQESDAGNESKNVIQATEFVTVNELATMMDVNVNQVISTCMSLGLFVSINQRLDAETINMVADEFGYEVEFVSVEVQEALDTFEQEEDFDEEDLEERAPIVTVMGHVDHGKTSLLDFIRKTNVIGGEAGGITQHIGAYEVKSQSGKRITFLDTPGHEAFTAMRARGAQVTDVAIIIIAADDKIMPQTVEAINHAQAAGVPIVFAINKIDKPGASPDRIKEELSQRNILVEEWGGKYQSHDISAKEGIGLEELLEKVLLESELLELKGNPRKMARGAVIESALDRGRGYIAKLLVQDGTLHKGDYVLAGAHSGKVKAMYNERNQGVDEAGPSSPVLMLGLDGAPQAGDQFNVLADEREAKEIAVKRRQLQREQGIRTQKHVTLDEIGRRIAIGDFKELNIIVKGDVDGSVEALADSLLKQSTDEVQLNVIHKTVGQISESDVMLASASDAIIVGFQVRPSLAARRLAEREQIDIRTYSVIYKAIEEIKAAMEGMLSPEIQEKITCNLEVRETFKITKVGTIAGCMVLDGVITRNTKVRIIRDGIVIYSGVLGSLKRYKDDVKEVKSGYECGLNIENFNDIKVGDIIEGYEQVEKARKL